MSEEQRPVDVIATTANFAEGTLRFAQNQVLGAQENVRNGATTWRTRLGIGGVAERLSTVEAELDGLPEAIDMAIGMVLDVRSQAKQLAYSAASMPAALAILAEQGRGAGHALTTVENVVDDLTKARRVAAEALNVRGVPANVVTRLDAAIKAAAASRDELRGLVGVTEDGAEAVDEATR